MIRIGSRAFIAALVGMIALAAIAGASAQSPEQSPRAAGVHVEVRVYQKITNADRVYVSAHAQGGPWEIPPVRLAFDGMGASGEWQYADAILEVDHWEVDVRVWQNVADHANLYISARLEGDPWSALGTVPLDMSGPAAPAPSTTAASCWATRRAIPSASASSTSGWSTTTSAASPTTAPSTARPCWRWST